MDTEPHVSKSEAHQIGLTLLDGKYSICKLSADYQPGQSPTGIVSVTVTERETSVVCPTGAEPDGARIEAGWRALYVDGPIPFGLTGVVAGITSAVASAGHPVFVISTFDSDLLFLQEDSLTDALRALTVSGYTINGMPPTPLP